MTARRLLAQHFAGRGDLEAFRDRFASFAAGNGFRHEARKITPLNGVTIGKVEDRSARNEHPALALLAMVINATNPRADDSAALPHVVCKVSGMVTEAMDARGAFNPEDLTTYLDTTLELFGPERLMFGSDWPVCLLAAPYAQVAGIVEQWAARLSASERGALWGDTARRVYRL